MSDRYQYYKTSRSLKLKDYKKYNHKYLFK